VTVITNNVIDQAFVSGSVWAGFWPLSWPTSTVWPPGVSRREEAKRRGGPTRRQAAANRFAAGRHLPFVRPALVL